MHCTDRTEDFLKYATASKHPGLPPSPPPMRATHAANLVRALHDAVDRAATAVCGSDFREQCDRCIDALSERVMTGELNAQATEHCDVVLQQHAIIAHRHFQQPVAVLIESDAVPTLAHRRARTAFVERYEQARALRSITRSLDRVSDTVIDVAALVHAQGRNVARIDDTLDGIESRLNGARGQIIRVLERRLARASRLTRMRCALVAIATCCVFVLLFF